MSTENPNSERVSVASTGLVRLLLRWTVIALDRGCCLFHWVPGYGCRMAKWSADLDAQYSIGEWVKMDAFPPDESLEDCACDSRQNDKGLATQPAPQIPE